MEKTGFSFSCLPLKDKKPEHGIDYAVLNSMVEKFIEKGGSFFETSYTYCGGFSEEAVCLLLTNRYKREEFILQDKLPCWMINRYEDCEKIFEKQLSRCKTGYFDIYLLDWMNEANYLTAENIGEFEFLESLKKEGKAKKTGFSFYGSPELLEKILYAHPEIDAVQLEINFLNWESPVYRMRECHEIAVKYKKEIIAFEPADEKSNSSASFRFVKSLPEVKNVLFGFKNPKQIDFVLSEKEPVSEEEILMLKKASDDIRAKKAVDCIGCGECRKVCPLDIPVPEYFEVFNEYQRKPEDDWKMEHAYSGLTGNFSRPSDCLRCRICEQNCPRKINIADTLRLVSRTFGY